MQESIDMNEIVGKCHILFVCIDSLRYDVAVCEQENGNTPVLNRYGKWRKCHAPGNFTYPSHQAMFAGFFPVEDGVKNMKQRQTLFFSEDTGLGRKAPDGAFSFSGPTFVQGLEAAGYETYCIGGLSFFDKRTDVGKVMPGYFKHSYWNPSFGCKVRESTKNQVDFAIRKMQEVLPESLVMMYMNISAIHYPNYFYVEGEAKDSVRSHAAALGYVDYELGRLFDAMVQNGKRDTFVIVCSDHGTCYGEDGYWYHGFNHPLVNTVPYKQFMLSPYTQYMYSYPHKTAYGPLEGVRLEDYIGNLAGKDNSLYFHIPFCQSKCGYCNLFSVTGQTDCYMEKYVDAMERQAEQIKSIMPPETDFCDLTLGGGTPLILPSRQMERIFSMAGSMGFKGTDGAIVVETSPSQTTAEKLALLKEKGVTRVSMGVQSFHDEELRALNRVHSRKEILRALQALKEAAFPCVNLDLIYGIPGQTRESLEESVKYALSYEPDELFIYPLYVKQETYLWQKHVMREPSAYRMYLWLREFLLERGYTACSMRRFVKGHVNLDMPGCGFGNTLSIGCGGRSYIGNLHFCTPYKVRQSSCLSVMNEYMNCDNYLQINHGYLLSEEEEKRRFVIKNILFGSGLDAAEYQAYFGSDAKRDYPLLSDWMREGFAVQKEGRIYLTEEGISLSDYLGPMLISDEVRNRRQQ